MSKEELRDKWAAFDADLRDYGEDNNYTLEWTKNGAKKKRVIQEVMHDDLNSENLA